MRATHGSEVRSESRRAMRKGTRSCYECRKRKVRCIFSKDSSVCEGCALRGKRCIEQSRDLLQDQGLESKESLKERVARLEAIIQASANQSKCRRYVSSPQLISCRTHTNSNYPRVRLYLWWDINYTQRQLSCQGFSAKYWPHSHAFRQCYCKSWHVFQVISY